jgi:excisionase family DNA binding protein
MIHHSAAETKITTITADQAAKLLGISKQALYAGARNGEIPCQRVGRRFIFILEVLTQWLLDAASRRT